MNNTSIIRTAISTLFSVVVMGSGLSHSSACAQMPQSPLESPFKEQKETPTLKEESLSLLKSPAASLRTFLTAMNESPPNYERAIFCFDLSENQTNQAANEIRANRLRVGLEFLGYTIKENAGVPSVVKGDAVKWNLFPPPPKASRYVQAQSKRISDVATQELMVCLVRSSTEDSAPWKFSTQTLSDDNLSGFRRVGIKLAESDPLLKSMFSENTIGSWVMLNMPPSLQEEFLFVMYWQWIGIALLVFLGLIIDLFFRIFFKSFLRHRLQKSLSSSELEFNHTSIQRTVRSYGFLLSAIIWRTGLVLFDFLPTSLEVLLMITNAILVIAIVIAAFRSTDLLAIIFSYRAAKSENKLDDIIVPLIRKSIKILIVVIGVIYLAEAVEIKITPLLAGLGIGGIGFAFAAQNSLENFFGSVTVLLDRPFQVGDWVVVEEIEGTVVSVGMRSTRIRTFYDSVVTLPNSALVTNKVNNYGMRTFRRWTSRLGILYETEPEQVEAFCEAVRQLIREHPYMRKDYYQVFLNEFAASGIEVLVYVFWAAPDWQTELRERHRFMLNIMRVARELGVSFAYPTQTVYISRAPEPTPPPKGLKSGQQQAANEKAGRDAARRAIEGAEWLGETPSGFSFHSSEDMTNFDQGKIELNEDQTSTEDRGSAGE